MKLEAISFGSSRPSPAGVFRAAGPGYGSPTAQQFTLPSQRVGTPQCPSGYSTTIRTKSGTNERYAICTPLPPRPPVITQAPAPVIAPRIIVQPSFQQQFTPQFSPTMQQQQDSPGATQASQPTQAVTAPQTTAIAQPTAPSGEAVATTALREEMLELFRYFATPQEPQAPQVPLPETTPIPMPEVIPAYYPGGPVTIGPRATDPEMEREGSPIYAAEKKMNIWPWLIGGGLFLMMG